MRRTRSARFTLVGDLGDDDLFAATLDLRHAHAPANAHLAAAGLEVLLDARGALQDGSPSGNPVP